MRYRLMAGTIWSAAAIAVSGGGYAQQAAPVQVAMVDDPDQVITITATRTEKPVDEVPATVTVIDAQKIEDELATDIEDLIRFEPGVSVRSAPTRFGAALGTTGREGNAGFNIRGLEGNRVLIQVDGVRVPDGYTFGAQSQGRGDFQDLDLMKSVEILRGPASALYGSDGVAGAVSFVTRDPNDLIQEGRSFGLRARTAYGEADDSWANSVMAATRFGQWSALIAYTRRDSHETENMGENFALNSTRTAPNPMEAESNSYLGKIVWDPTDNQRFRFTYDRTDREVTTEVYTGRTAPPAPPAILPTTAVIDLDAFDTNWRERYSFDHAIDFGDGFFRSGQWNVYTQAAKTRQFTDEDRNGAADRLRDVTFDNRIWGAGGQLEGGFTTGWAEHAWLLGGDYSSTTQSSIRSGTVPPAGEVFPSRPFPNTEYNLTGVFLQDEISLLGGALLLYPALRYDAYELNSTRDALYPATGPAANSDGDQVSPKFGIVAWPSDWIGGFFNYAAGYKAPAPSQVNSSFANPTQFYMSIANPNLKPESSDSIEAGVRIRNIDFLGASISGNFTGFAADYEDFIEQVLVSGALTPANPGVFQYINLTGATVNGLEGRLDAIWDNGVGFTLAASHADGDGHNGGVTTPLQSVDPLKIVAGLSYRDPAGRFGGQVIATYSDSKPDRLIPVNTNASATDDLFTGRSFIILDLTAYWNITDWLALRVGAFNVTDEKYWWWSDYRGLTARTTQTIGGFPTIVPNPIRDAYSQPGRNFSASLTFKY